MREVASTGPMRVAFVGRRYWPAVGGVESLMRSLAHELSARHELRVLALRIDEGPLERLSDSLRPPPAFDAFDDGPVRVEPLVVPIPRRLLLAPLLADVTPGLRRYAYGRLRLASAALYARVVAPVVARKIRGVDLVHGWGGDLLAAAIVRAASFLGVPAVLSPSAHRSQWGDDPASAAAYRAADRVLAQLDTEGALYRHLGVAEERVVVCGACSPRLPSGEPVDVRREFGIDGPLVLFLGVRRPHKGVDVLLQAAPRVTVARTDVTFAFVGPGPRIPASESSGAILDIGAVGEQERAAWLRAADLVCLPSAGESFGIAVIEAWSAKTPVLVSDIPILRELVTKADGGLVASRDPEALATAIISLLNDPGRLRSLGNSGYAHWSAHYTVPRVAARVERVYQDLLGSPSPSAPPARGGSSLGPAQTSVRPFAGYQQLEARIPRNKS